MDHQASAEVDGAGLTGRLPGVNGSGDLDMSQPGNDCSQVTSRSKAARRPGQQSPDQAQNNGKFVFLTMADSAATSVIGALSARCDPHCDRFVAVCF